MNRVFSLASKVAALPGLSWVSPSASDVPSAADLDGYLKSQRLAHEAAAAVAAQMREGWTETQAADLLNTYLADCGVHSYFHKAFVWYGERTRFHGVKTYFDYMPSKRVLLPGEVYILDVAPIFNGYICDIGYTASLGRNPALDAAKQFLAELRRDIPRMFERASSGGGVWAEIDERIISAGYDNIHALYPFSVLGHRVHQVKLPVPRLNFINFGFQSYWEFLSRGLFGQLLNMNYNGRVTGLWAIEPHIGTPDFGAKFEEILVVDEDGARWLDPSS